MLYQINIVSISYHILSVSCCDLPDSDANDGPYFHCFYTYFTRNQLTSSSFFSDKLVVQFIFRDGFMHVQLMNRKPLPHSVLSKFCSVLPLTFQ